MGKIKYKARRKLNPGEWSDESLLAAGKAYKGMSEAKFWSRFKTLKAKGDAIRAEDARNVMPPPYVMRLILNKDAKGLASYLGRRGATFDLKKWCKANNFKL